MYLKPPPDIILLFNQFNNTSPEKHSNLKHVTQSKYYGIDEI